MHAVKPSVCALYPLGRFMQVETEAFNRGELGGATVQYLLQDDVDCGDKSKTHTVREWLLGGFIFRFRGVQVAPKGVHFF